MRSRARRSGLLVTVAGLLLAGVTVAGAVGTTTSNSGTRGVILFLGDSNVTLAAQNIDWSLTWNSHADNGYVPVMASRVGSSIRTPDCLQPSGCATFDYWKTRLASLNGKVVPDAIVVNLGINDTASLGTSTTPGYASYPKKIDWFMALAAGRPVLWTNLPCSIEPASRSTGCTTVNYALSLATERWPNLTVLEWNRRALNHTEYMAAPGVDVHYSARGLAAWTAFVVEALDRRFPAL